jgi:hypothetical protein
MSRKELRETDLEREIGRIESTEYLLMEQTLLQSFAYRGLAVKIMLYDH